MVRKSLIGMLVSAAGFAGSAYAAPVTWGASHNTSTFADVSLNGTVVQAVNLTAVGIPGTTTVNGVVFTNSDLFLSNTSSQHFLAGATTGDAGYNALLNGLDFGNGNPYTLQIGGGLLHIGSKYELQVWYTDLRTLAAGRTMTYGDGLGNNVSLTATGNGFGQFAIGTFTADATNQNLFMATNGFANVHLTAFQIRAVPEPASLLLVGLALLGVGASRRFSR